MDRKILALLVMATLTGVASAEIQIKNVSKKDTLFYSVREVDEAEFGAWEFLEPEDRRDIETEGHAVVIRYFDGKQNRENTLYRGGKYELQSTTLYRVDSPALAPAPTPTPRTVIPQEYTPQPVVQHYDNPVAQQHYQPPVQQHYQPPVQQHYQPPVQQHYQPPVQQHYQPPVQHYYYPPVQRSGPPVGRRVYRFWR